MQDARTSPLEIEAWRAQTTAQCSVRFFVGDHFFVKTALPELLETIGALLNGSMNP
jgi:surfactin synthase thioesterase subunit